ncbi:MAG: hypothetical protein IPI97_08320 [Nitrosomonas sp.]|nr:hypothetical protein [Nitrosomonas sp.]MBK7364990.1 hypothetical protein [Nitrosomonas sp.]
MKSEKLSILSIFIFSLCIGLLAGAGAGNDHILPVTLVTAIALTLSRDKIAARSNVDREELNNDDFQSNPHSGNYYTWPELNQFQYEVRSNSYQDAINQLLQEDVSNSATMANDAPLILNAQLITDSEHLYDKNAVRIDIHVRTIGYLGPDEALAFHGRLNQRGLANQVTVCKALVYKKTDNANKNNIYGVKLDIEPFLIPEKNNTGRE